MYREQEKDFKQDYLLHLGRGLLWFFPVSQVLEILSDYQNYMQPAEEGNRSEVWAERWGMLFLLSIYCYTKYGLVPAFAISLITLFCALQGWKQR